MALKVDNKIVIYHVPKTGGVWLAEALRVLGVPFEATKDRHVTPREYAPPGLPKVAFVRHPLSWYKSYFDYKLHNREYCGWSSQFDKDCQSGTFGEFIERVLEKHPGFLTKWFKEYMGEDWLAVDEIGCQESLSVDCARIMTKYGIPMTEERLTSVPRLNSMESQHSYLTDQIPAIEKAESETIARFYSG